jgi:uncharacterized protein YggT (Ycf19 family)
MNTILDILRFAIQFYLICMIVYMLLSWLPMISPDIASNEFLIGTRRFMASIVEPYVALFRQIIPPMGGFDLAFMAAFFLLIIVQRNL